MPRPTNPPDDLLDADEAARRLGLHPETLRRLHRAGKIPAFKVGKKLRFDLAEIREACRSTPNNGRAVAAAPDFDAIQ